MGKMIVLEGVDGAGKSTLVELMADILRGEGHKVATTAFPSKGPIGTLVRQHILSKNVKATPEALQHMFVADFVNESENLHTLVDTHDYTIVDRHPHVSSWVYAPEIPLPLLMKITHPEYMRTPDLTFILDLTSKEAMARLLGRGTKPDLFDDTSERVFEMRRTRYVSWTIMTKWTFAIVSAVGDRDDVAAGLVREMRRLTPTLN